MLRLSLLLFIVAQSSVAWISTTSCNSCAFRLRDLKLKDALYEEDIVREHWTLDLTRQRHKIAMEDGKFANVISRSVSVTEDCNITVWEWEKPAAVIETYWQVHHQGLTLDRNAQRQQMLDPFGLVMWPGSVIAVQELFQHAQVIRNKSVLVLGAGVGLEAQAAAFLGAAHVHATDIHPTTLQLLQYGATKAGLNVSTAVLDLFDQLPLPPCDVLIAADVLYNDKLSAQLIQRCVEVYRKNTTILITDSQRFCHTFEADMNEQLSQVDAKRKRVAWVSRWLPEFTGSGVVIDADQTYEVKARVMWIRLGRTSKRGNE